MAKSILQDIRNLALLGHGDAGKTTLAEALLFKAGMGNEAMAKLIKSPFWVTTSFMLIFFGVQFLSMGLLAEIQIRTYHESQNKPIYVIKEIVEPDA